MNTLELQNAHGYLNGSCFGLWDISDPACNKCLICKECEIKIKRKSSTHEEILTESVVLKEDEDLPEISPLEYLIDSLKGRFDYNTKSNEKAIAHYFTKDELPILNIIVSKESGKIKLESSVFTTKIIDGFNSIEEVEGIIKEVVK